MGHTEPETCTWQWDCRIVRILLRPFAFRLVFPTHDGQVTDFPASSARFVAVLAILVEVVGQSTPTAFNFRPIALLPAVYEVDMTCLIIFAGPWIYELQAPQFAFRPGHQVGEVIFISRRMIELHVEWSEPLFALDGDLHKA